MAAVATSGGWQSVAQLPSSRDLLRLQLPRWGACDLPRSRCPQRSLSTITCSGCYEFPQSEASVVPTIRKNSALEKFSSPKRGVVGEERFKEAALPGTYWGNSAEHGAEEVVVEFNRGSENVVVTAKSGENLLRLAERCGVMMPNIDFCFEGSCCHCEMEVVGGAHEVGYRADNRGSELIRSCMCPVPNGKRRLKVNLINDEDVWGEGVV